MEQTASLSRKQLALLISPVRQQILQALCDQELSAAQLARRIDSPPSNLYYHLKRMQKARLIRVARSVPRRGMVERYYQAVARGFSLGEETLRIIPRQRNVDADMMAAIRSAWENAESAFRASLQAGLLGEGSGSEVPVVNFCRVRAGAEELKELAQIVVDWVNRCLKVHRSGGEAEYALFNMFFPTELPRQENSEARRPNEAP